MRTHEEAISQFQADNPMLAEKGIILSGVQSYIPEGWGQNFQLAMDAQPTLSTDPNSAVPAMLTTMIDPTVIRILFAPNNGAKILGEVKKGTWLDETAMFPVVEHTGEVSSYGDYAENGRAGANTNWPQRQSYIFQTIKEYGERELERAGLARINWVSEIDVAAATVLSKFGNLGYFFGIAGLQNYGLTNDPNLPTPISPAPKAYGGVKWVNNGVVVASANEIYNDIQSMFLALTTQSAGLINQETPVVLAMSPTISIALTATNSFNVNVKTLLKDNFPNIRFETAVQYGALSASNPQGIAGGNLVQMIAENVEGQQTGYCAFNEKQRSHPIIRQLSSFKQKLTAGIWGAIIRQPFAIAQLLGV